MLFIFVNNVLLFGKFFENFATLGVEEACHLEEEALIQIKIK